MKECFNDGKYLLDVVVEQHAGNKQDCVCAGVCVVCERVAGSLQGSSRLQHACLI